MATLYITATPIGNLEDITYRAVRILGSVEVIAAEDTRQTRKLLEHYEISPSMLLSCRSHNEENSARGIVKLLNQGNDVAYVSDAGTPCISDPGSRLVRIVRESEHNIVPLPGASAITAVMSVAGIAARGFVFEGFLSPKSGRRRKRLKELLQISMVFILYESPFRIISLLKDFEELAPTCRILIGREITKKFEEFLSGTPLELLSKLSRRNTIKGEIVLIAGEEK